MVKMRRFLATTVFLILAGASFDAWCDGLRNQSLDIDDGVNRKDPNFITASVLLIEPDENIYSGVGHVCFRLECPTYKMDYCFSYESESVKQRVLTFFAGNLKMGMFATPAAEYLKPFKETGRGVRQYKLNLPPEVKQKLWKLLDGKVAEGAYLPYDYDKRGCAWTVLSTLMNALRPEWLEVKGRLPAKFAQSRRELLHAALEAYPWNRFFLHAIWGVGADREMPRYQNIVVPADLIEFLARATFRGMALLGEEAEVVVSTRMKEKPSSVSPIVAACCVVALAILGWFLKSRLIDIILLAVQTSGGVFFCYLVFISKLPGTTWNWLIVPFNVLPLVFWKWREMWAAWFVGVLVLWEVFMLVYPHRLTDTAFVILALAYIVQYAKFVRRHS